jgi:hypothetical protein
MTLARIEQQSNFLAKIPHSIATGTRLPLHYPADNNEGGNRYMLSKKHQNSENAIIKIFTTAAHCTFQPPPWPHNPQIRLIWGNVSNILPPLSRLIYWWCIDFEHLAGNSTVMHALQIGADVGEDLLAFGDKPGLANSVSMFLMQYLC